MNSNIVVVREMKNPAKKDVWNMRIKLNQGRLRNTVSTLAGEYYASIQL